MIADYKKTPRPKWAVAMLLLTALACVVLTNAYVARADFVFSTPINIGPPVNSSYGDFAIEISADGLSLYFASDRPGGYGDYDIWVATREDLADSWGTPVNLGSIVNSAHLDAMPCITSDGLELFFDSFRPGGYGESDIWVTKRETIYDSWGEPINLGPVINTIENDDPGSISSDGLTLYFNSHNRPGGYGWPDIWTTTRPTKNDAWETPVNLGPLVNSKDADGFPRISDNDLSLFFTSDRPGSYGEFDLWVIKRASSADPWGEPVNLGPEVNSPYCETTVTISSDGRNLYFADWGLPRPQSLGSCDIWQVSILPIVDFNGDGNIDTDDLLILIGYWGQNEPLCDIGPMPYGDGIVDIKDLEVFMSYWEKENMPETPEEEQ